MNYFNYFTEIEETFIRRRGRNLLLSPLDWALIESWQERGIPLHIVVRGIEAVFDGYEKQPNQRRTVKSLSYCRDEIETRYAVWLEMQIGKKAQNAESGIENFDKSDNSANGELFSDEMILAHLKKISGELKTAKSRSKGSLREILEKVLRRLSELENEHFATEKLEEIFENLDDSIDKILLESYADKKLKTEVEKQIASYKNKMEADVYERTFDLMLLKRLREQAEIPPLSLFYL